MPRSGSAAAAAADRESLFQDIEDLLYLGERGINIFAQRTGYQNPESLKRQLQRHRPDLLDRIREPQ